MLSIREIARNLGCSRQYIQRKVKEGCPTDTLENVRLWFQANTQRSRISQRRLEKIIADENDGASSGPRALQKESLKDQPEGAEFVSDESLESSVHGIKKAVKESSRLLD